MTLVEFVLTLTLTAAVLALSEARLSIGSRSPRVGWWRRR